MARPRTPSNILHASGAFKKNPKRQLSRAGEPTPPGYLGPAPSHLTDEAAVVWDEILSGVAPGQLTSSDALIFEMLVNLTVDVRKGERHPRILAEIRHLCVQIGLTPSSRSKVQVVPPKSEAAKKFGSL